MRDPDKYLWHRPDPLHIPRLHIPMRGVYIAVGLGLALWAFVIAAWAYR